MENARVQSASPVRTVSFNHNGERVFSSNQTDHRYPGRVNAVADRKHAGGEQDGQQNRTDIVTTGHEGITPDQGDANATLLNRHHPDKSVVGQFLCKMWRQQDLCDLILKIGRYELLAHKLVLAAHSQQFTAQCIAEAPMGLCEISLNDTTVEATQEVLKFVYTKDISLTSLNIEHVISTASQLGVTDVLQASRTFLQNFNNETVLHFMWTSEKFDFMDICTDLYDYICRNIVQLSQTESFLNCSVDKVLRLLQEDNLNVNGELDVYFVATNWLDYNRQERIQYTNDILDLVRMALIVPDDLVKYVEPNLQHYWEDCGTVLTDVFRYHALRYSGGGVDANLPKRRQYTPLAQTGQQIDTESDFSQNNSCTDHIIQLIQRSHEVPRTKHESIDKQSEATVSDFLTFGGITVRQGSNHVSRMVEEYTLKTNSCRPLTKLPDSRYAHGLILVDEFIYLIGGLLTDTHQHISTDTDTSTSTCYRYSYKQNYWCRIADLNMARSYHGTAVLDGIVYVLGGQDIYGRHLNSVEFYNVETDTWTETSPLSEAKQNVAAIGYHGKVFCIGGVGDNKGDNSVLTTVESFCPSKNLWEQQTQLPNGRCKANVVNVQDRLYLIGGCTVTDDTEINLVSILHYNVANKQWETYCHMTIPRHNTGCSVTGSKIYIIGGSSSGQTLDTIESVDTETGLCEVECQQLSCPVSTTVCSTRS